MLTSRLVTSQYQEIQPVIERVVEKPKVIEQTQNIKEIVHEWVRRSICLAENHAWSLIFRPQPYRAPKVHQLRTEAPISIDKAEPLLKVGE